MFTGRKLPLTLAFGVLVIVAIGASCKGFFPDNTLQSVAIQPSTLNFQVNATQQFSAWGTYQDGTRAQITSGVVWISSSPNVTITNGGLATAQSVTTSAVTITGSAQALQGTATVNVIGNVTSMTVNPTTGTIAEGGSGTTFTFVGSPGPPTYITADNGGILTVTPTGSVSSTLIGCTVSTDKNGNPTELCTAQTTAVTGNPWSITMSYPTPSGGTAQATATVTATGN